MDRNAEGTRPGWPKWLWFLICGMPLLAAYVWWTSEPQGVGAVPAADGPPRGYDSRRDVQASAEARQLLEKTLLEAAEGSDEILKYVDISIDDGHLVVHFKELYSELDPRARAGYEEAIGIAWRSTTYVKDRDWSPNVEFVEHVDGKAQSRIDRPARR